MYMHHSGHAVWDRLRSMKKGVISFDLSLSFVSVIRPLSFTSLVLHTYTRESDCMIGATRKRQWYLVEAEAETVVDG